MTKPEKEILSLLKNHPATKIRGRSTYTVGPKRVRETTLLSMQKKGLLEIGIHPKNLGRTGFIIAQPTLKERT